LTRREDSIDSKRSIRDGSSIRDVDSRLEKFMMREESIVRADSIRRESSIESVDSMLKEDSADFEGVYIATNYCLSF
jgi:hypothetical protein